MIDAFLCLDRKGREFLAGGLYALSCIDLIRRAGDFRKASRLITGNGSLETDGTRTYTYDVENRLTCVTGEILPQGSRSQTDCEASADYIVTYTYDPLGRRAGKSGPAIAPEEYLSDGVEEIADYDGAGPLGGNILRRYVHGPGVDEPVVMYSYNLAGAVTGQQYYHADYAGSIIAMSGANGAMVETYTYSAYGEVNDTSGNPFRYTGRRLDPETGLYYYRSRYYSSAIGRFLQTDAIGYGDNMNLYAYVGNDPVNATDPSGLCGTSSNISGRDNKSVPCRTSGVEDNRGETQKKKKPQPVVQVAQAQTTDLTATKREEVFEQGRQELTAEGILKKGELVGFENKFATTLLASNGSVIVSSIELFDTNIEALDNVIEFTNRVQLNGRTRPGFSFSLIYAGATVGGRFFKATSGRPPGSFTFTDLQHVKFVIMHERAHGRRFTGGEIGANIFGLCMIGFLDKVRC